MAYVMAAKDWVHANGTRHRFAAFPGRHLARRTQGSMSAPGPMDEEWDGIPVAMTDSGGMAGEELRPYTLQYDGFRSGRRAALLGYLGLLSLSRLSLPDPDAAAWCAPGADPPRRR